MGFFLMHSSILQEQLDRYTNISHKYETKFIYETNPTPLVGGTSMMVVTLDASTIYIVLTYTYNYSW